ncbi:ABC-type oligopeptide transport system substrate-binding subunit [Enterococcus sp. PF1-24]|uniref:DUF6440 family protein n=1 Tax=unclassified Enterococcus TaxID=2608891 RepID=UPI0024736C1A|nr:MULTISPECIES: DUF6440 family protein [unclassified Enterococcus]MDH6364502.1 ABC-type oligopeptide transport system substrate-binding subunit [Enterococcus sp. PFB1-1]MDH6401621.1 ABC-type oligopeptide transport system substrate-binding subunit [Enterococcus sp. PF1-24]
MSIMRKIRMIFVLALACIIFSACESNSKPLSGGTDVFVDSETGVNYLKYKTARGSSLSVRYNADGTIYVTPLESKVTE